MRVCRAFVASYAGALVVAIPAGECQADRPRALRRTDTDTFTDTECGAPITIDYSAEFSGVFKLQVRTRRSPRSATSSTTARASTLITNVANDKTVTLLRHDTSRTSASSTSRDHLPVTAIESGRPIVAIGPTARRRSSTGAAIRDRLVETLGDSELGNDIVPRRGRAVGRRSAPHLRRSRRLLRRPRRDPLAAAGPAVTIRSGRPLRQLRRRPRAAGSCT